MELKAITSTNPTTEATPGNPLVLEYGTVKLPKGSVLVREQSIYSYGRNYKDSDWTEPCIDTRRVGVVRLPNGVEVTLQKNPWSEYRNGNITIETDGSVVFDRVQYTSIVGTDKDDKFVFKNNPEMDYVDKYIMTRKGNDTVVDPSSHGSKAQYGHVHIIADENLKVVGKVWNTALRANGNLDTTKVTDAIRNWQDVPTVGAINIEM